MEDLVSMAEFVSKNNKYIFYKILNIATQVFSNMYNTYYLVVFNNNLNIRNIMGNHTIICNYSL